MVTCCERAGLLALVGVMFSYVFIIFPYSVLGQVWYLIVSIPDLCPLFLLTISSILTPFDAFEISCT